MCGVVMACQQLESNALASNTGNLTLIREAEEELIKNKVHPDSQAILQKLDYHILKIFLQIE
jgi:hypothetical protein